MFRTIAQIGWSSRASNVQYWATGHEDFLSQCITFIRLCRLGHVVCMANVRPPHRALLSVTPTEWKKPHEDEQMTTQRGMRKC